MKARKEPVSVSSITRANSDASREIERVLKQATQLQTDPDKAERLNVTLCRSCYYIRTGRIGGASMTTKPCGICDDEMLFPSTATDKMCQSCAAKNLLCKRCGADIELKNRRKKYPFQSQ
jgi:hypothetical protein